MREPIPSLATSCVCHPSAPERRLTFSSRLSLASKLRSSPVEAIRARDSGVSGGRSQSYRQNREGEKIEQPKNLKLLIVGDILDTKAER